MTKEAVALFTFTRVVIRSLVASKRIEKTDIVPFVKDHVAGHMKKVGDCFKKDRKLKNEIKAVEDGLALLQFYVQPEVRNWAKDQDGQIDFFGNKILTGGDDKTKAWYKHWRNEICKNVTKFVTTRFGDSNNPKRDGGDFKTNFDTFIKESGASVPVSKPVEEKKEEKAKPVAKAKTEKKREPSERVVKGQLIEVLYHDGVTKTLEGDNVTREVACNFIGSKNCNFIIKGKVKAVSMSNCEKCALIVDSTLTYVELIKCKGVNVQVVDTTSQVILDRCEETKLFLSEEGKSKCKILSTNSQRTFINFPAPEDDEGNDSRALPIPESYVTSIENDCLVTKVSEAIE